MDKKNINSIDIYKDRHTCIPNLYVERNNYNYKCTCNIHLVHKSMNGEAANMLLTHM